MRAQSMLLPMMAAILAGCATTMKNTASAEEMEECKAMAAAMGTARAHSHFETKGTIISTPMNAKHDRCRAILANQP